MTSVDRRLNLTATRERRNSSGAKQAGRIFKECFCDLMELWTLTIAAAPLPYHSWRTAVLPRGMSAC